MGKYDLLRDYLYAQDRHLDELSMSFAEIDPLVRQLPRSARTNQSWWTTASNGRTARQAWRSAGWHIRSVDQMTEQVTFARDAAVSDEEIVVKSSSTMRSSGGIAAPIATAEQSGISPGPGQQEKWETRRAVISDFAIGLVAAATAGVSGIVGVEDLPWPMLGLLCAATGGLAFMVSQAIALRKEVATARRWWSMSTMALVILCTAAFVYHKYFDPSTHSPHTYQFVVNGTQVDYIPLYGEAGGSEQSLATGTAGQNGLTGGQTYDFDCWVIGLDNAEWLRYERFGQTWWAPRALLHLPIGQSQPPIPHC